MADDNELQIKITADTKDIKSGTQEAAQAVTNATSQIQGSSDSMNSVTESIGAGWLSVGAKVAAASAIIYGSIAVIKQFVNEAAEAETVEKRLQFALEGAGYAWTSAKSSVDQFANSILETTRFTDEDARRALTDLMLYTNEYAKAETGARLAMDMSIRTGQDLHTTSRLIGMAMTGNVEMLGRYLPQLRNLDNVLGSNATMAEKAEYALKILQEKFGGTAAKDLDTYSGRLANMKNQWSELKEELGTGLLPTLTKILKAMTDIIESARKISAFKLREQTYEMGISPETGLPFPVPGGRTPEAYPTESEKRFTGWGMGAGVPKDVFAEKPKYDIVKEIESALEGWIARENELGQVALAQWEARERYYPKEKDLIKQIEDELKNYERATNEAGEIAVAKQELTEASWRRTAEEMTRAVEERIHASRSAIDVKMDEVRSMAEIGQIGADQEYALMRNLAREKYETEKDLLLQMKEIWSAYPEEYRKVMDRIRELDEKNRRDLQKIEAQKMKDLHATIKSYTDEFSAALGNTITGLINGTTTWYQAVTNLLNSLLNMFIRFCMEWLSQWLAAQITGLVTARSTESEKAVASITASAATGAAAAAAANAETAYGAAAAAAAMYAEIMAWMPAAFAEQGFDVDKNTLAYLHKNEMVLPADLAEGVRGMVAGGGQATAPSGPAKITVNNKYITMDSMDLSRFVKRRGATLYSGLKSVARSYGVR